MRYVIEKADGSRLKDDQGELHVFASLADAREWLLPKERVRPAERIDRTADAVPDLQP